MCSAKPIKKVQNAYHGGKKDYGNQGGAAAEAGVLGAQKVDADDADLNIKKKTKQQKKAAGNAAYKNTVAKTNAVNAAGTGSGVNVTGG